MGFDSPWKIAVLIAAVAALRFVWWRWKTAPARRSLIELFDSLLMALVLVFLLIRPFIVQAFYIPSESMLPGLRVGDRLLVNKFIYRLLPPRRGDIIVFIAPPQATKTDREVDYIKRLIGLPGDRISVRAYDGVYVNGRKLDEPYPAETPHTNYPEDGEEFIVPRNAYFVMGDNRNNSTDSRAWGPLPARNVLGKAMVVFFPPQRIGLLSDNRIYAKDDRHTKAFAGRR